MRLTLANIFCVGVYTQRARDLATPGAAAPDRVASRPQLYAQAVDKVVDKLLLNRGGLSTPPAIHNPR